jgi:Skp family chaperone for outer membrane proteins
MTTYILDFEEVLKNFEPYHQSLKLLQTEKQEFALLIDKIKKEMEQILASQKSLILDETTNRKNQERFRELQTQAVKAEQEFRNTIVVKQNDELEKNFKIIIDIVNEWSEQNSVDCVINKSSVVFVNTKFEITEKIMNVIKEKNLFAEYVEGMYELEPIQN